MIIEKIDKVPLNKKEPAEVLNSFVVFWKICLLEKMSSVKYRGFFNSYNVVRLVSFERSFTLSS